MQKPQQQMPGDRWKPSHRKKKLVKKSSFGSSSIATIEPLKDSEVDFGIAFFDADEEGLTATSIHSRLSSLEAGIELKDIQWMMGDSETLSIEELHELLAERKVPKYDPVEDIFSSIIHNKQGVIDDRILRNVMKNLGHGEISDEEATRLMQAADQDKDGVIGLEDFKNLNSFLEGGPLSYSK